MNTIEILRDKFSVNQTQGVLFVLDENKQIIFKCFTLELPWKYNQKYVSCIQAGKYNLHKRYSKKFKHHLHIRAVPNRTYILIHPANHVRELLGCIAVGETRRDIDKDGLTDVTDSGETLNKLMALLPDETTIKII